MKRHFIFRTTVSKMTSIFWISLLIFFVFAFFSFSLNGQTCHCANLGSPKVGASVGIYTLSQAIGASILPAGSTATSLNLCINGDFLINQTYTFNDCEINVAPDSKVTVGIGSDLNIIDSEVFGCNEMWNSIYLEQVPYGWTNAGIFVTNSIISDAEVGIDIGVHNDLYLDNASFLSNFIGVRAFAEDDGGSVNVIKFDNVGFTTGLTLGSNPLPPHANEIMYAGVFLDKVYGFPVGTGQNVAFFQLRNGIVSHASTFTANFSGFYTSLSTGFPTTSNITEDNWNGILMYNSQAVVANSDFDNNTVGVHAINSNITLLGNALNETVPYGVYVNGNLNGRVTIQNNEFINSKAAVYLSNVQGAKVIIEDNNIEIIEESDLANEDGFAGMLLEECHFPNHRRALIANNTINIRDARFGVLLLASTGVDVLGSDTAPISFLPNNGNFDYSPSVLAGIDIQGGGDHTITENSIVGQGATVSLPGANKFITGIRASISDNNLFCGNTADDIEVGVRVQGANMGAQLLGTDFNSHDVALSLDADGIIGEQKGAGNKWNVASIDKGARHENINPLFSLFSQFLVDEYDMPTTPEYPDGIEPDPTTSTANWFLDDNSPTGDCATGFTPDDEPSVVDVAIAQGTVISGTTFSNTTKWQLERYLYSKLEKYPTIVQQHPIMDTFYNSKLNTNLGKLHRIEMGIAELCTLPSTEVDQYEVNLDSLLFNLKRLITIYDSLAIANTYQATILTAERQSRLQNMKNWETVNDSLRHIIQSHRDTLILQYLDENAALTSTTVYEANEQTVNDIFLNTLAKGIYSFTLLQSSYLDSIANQCPYMGGSAVYRARAMYQLIEKRNYNDQDICFPPSSPLIQPPSPSGQFAVTNGVSLHPNPTSQELVIEMNKGEKANRVKIISMSGQIIAMYDFIEPLQKMKINVETIPSGIYFVELRDVNHKLSTEKLVVQR